MAEYMGSAVVVSWVWSGGTLTLSGETRNCAVTPTQDTVDATAGSDPNRQYLPSFVDWTITWDGVAQNNATAATAGTAYAQALLPGNTGTVTVGPYGTASNSLRYQMPAFSQGASITAPYADVVTVATSWRTSSGGTMSVGNY